jgi:hypothetical protein
MPVTPQDDLTERVLRELESNRLVRIGSDDKGRWVSTTYLLVRGARGRIVPGDRGLWVHFPVEKAPLRESKSWDPVDTFVAAAHKHGGAVFFTVFVWLASILAILVPLMRGHGIDAIQRLVVLPVPIIWTYAIWMLSWRSLEGDKVKLAQHINEASLKLMAREISDCGKGAC